MAKIKCTDCRYAVVDQNASDYTQKRCKGCELDSDCEYKGTGSICPKQKLKWAAIQCGCSNSDYYRALLNITPGGDKQEQLCWSGCEDGERRCGQTRDGF